MKKVHHVKKLGSPAGAGNEQRRAGNRVWKMYIYTWAVQFNWQSGQLTVTLWYWQFWCKQTWLRRVALLGCVALLGWRIAGHLLQVGGDLGLCTRDSCTKEIAN